MESCGSDPDVVSEAELKEDGTNLGVVAVK
jgi:hypothetical protein